MTIRIQHINYRIAVLLHAGSKYNHVIPLSNLTRKIVRKTIEFYYSISFFFFEKKREREKYTYMQKHTNTHKYKKKERK